MKSVLYSFDDWCDPKTFQGWCHHPKTYHNNSLQYVECNACWYKCSFSYPRPEPEYVPGCKLYHAEITRIDDKFRHVVFAFFPKYISENIYEAQKSGKILTNRIRYDCNIKQVSIKSMNDFIDKARILI